MAKLSSTASDKDKTALDTTANVISGMANASGGFVISAVQRKVNIGNYETIDIYQAVGLPLNIAGEVDLPSLIEALEETSAIGFDVAARLTADKYNIVKDSLKRERK